MKALTWLIRLVLFLVVLTFSVRNTDVVAIRWLPGIEVQTPLILALLVAFLLGAAFAWLVLMPSWLRARRQANVASKKLSKSEKDSTPALPQAADANLTLPLGPGHGI